MLTPAAFEVMALAFAERAASHAPSWVWVPASDNGPLLAPAAGFLRSAAILVLPPPVSGLDPAPSDAGLVDESVDDDDAAAVRASPSAHRLELHIVDSGADTVLPPGASVLDDCDGPRAPASCGAVRTEGAGSLATVHAPWVGVPASSVPDVCRCRPCAGARLCAAYPVRRVPCTRVSQVYSETYRVPVLLLQGYGDDGRPWRVEP